MRARLAALAFLFSALATGICWLTLQPLLVRLMEPRPRGAPPLGGHGALPLLLGLDLIAVFLIGFGLLQWTFGRQLRQTESLVEHLGQLDSDVLPGRSGGSLFSRLQSSLRRTSDALAAERALTRKQLDELKAANASLAKAQVELVAAERLAMVGELAAGIAHEVGNPLSGILGYLSIAQDKARGQDALLDCLQRSEVELHRINEIVRSLLELGKPPTGRAAPTQLTTILNNCIRLVRANAAFKKVEFVSALPDELWVLAQPGPLTQVFLNLFLNAAQAMGGEGRISIALADGVEARVRVRVSDSGPGLSPEAREHLFRPFFTTKSAGAGTGLGLAVSRHLMRSLKGELTLADASGSATFLVELPASPGASQFESP